MENVKWYSSSQVLTAKHVSYPQLTATVFIPQIILTNLPLLKGFRSELPPPPMLNFFPILDHILRNSDKQCIKTTSLVQCIHQMYNFITTFAFRSPVETLYHYLSLFNFLYLNFMTDKKAYFMPSFCLQ